MGVRHLINHLLPLDHHWLPTPPPPTQERLLLSLLPSLLLTLRLPPQAIRQINFTSLLTRQWTVIFYSSPPAFGNLQPTCRGKRNFRRAEAEAEDRG